MSAETYVPPEEEADESLDPSGSTGFYLWLLITVSAGIIMAQDTWVSMQQPRLSTVDATAAFTKVLVIHAIWLVVTLGFVLYTWFKRPNSAWKVHLVIGGMTVIWTLTVLIWNFTSAERLEVVTWQCDTSPTSEVATQEFLDSCEPADLDVTIRLGGDIFLWSGNDTEYWRWIVPGEGRSALMSDWPSEMSAMYLATDEDNATLSQGSVDSIPGGTWSDQFDPNEARDLNIYFISNGPGVRLYPATPESRSPGLVDEGLLFHERFKYAR